MSKISEKTLDCLIIGAGPAGISAALYLLRFRRSIMIVDTNQSRALLIPRSHNYPGFLNGISGPVLLKRLKTQLESYSCKIQPILIDALKVNSKGLFIANDKIKSRTVILATGVQDIEPKLPQIEEAIHRGLVRHCPICDAYEVIDKKIAILSNSNSGLNEAIFLRRYSPYVYLLTQGQSIDFTKEELQKIKDAKIKLIENPIVRIDMSKNRISAVYFSDQDKYTFDTIYSALGCKKHNTLALNLGASHEKGELIVDSDQQTSIPGLYAAGDIVSGLNQICVAQSQGAIAATSINKLCLQQDTDFE